MGEKDIFVLKLIIRSQSQDKKTVDWLVHKKTENETDMRRTTSVWNSDGDLLFCLQEIFNQHKDLKEADVTCDWPSNEKLHRKLSKWLFELWQVSDVSFKLPPKETSKTSPTSPTSPKEGSETPSKEGSKPSPEEGSKPSPKEGTKVPELKSSGCLYRMYGTDYIQWCWQDLNTAGKPRETKEAQVPAEKGQKT